MRTNQKRASIHTHEGAVAKHITPEAQLQRSILSCFLWENEFYEDGKTIADRITEYADKCKPRFVAQLAHKARDEYHLRHVPLLLLLSAIKNPSPGLAEHIAKTIQRPDEIMELVSMYWKDGKRPLSKQLKLGLAKAIGKFSEYQLQKYNRDTAIKLRDVMFMVRPKPEGKEQEALFKRIAEDTMAKPDTWESRMAGGENKKVVFSDLMDRGKLGYMALLRNLRGMTEAGVSADKIRTALMVGNTNKVLPFRFISAAKHAPQFERELDAKMLDALRDLPQLEGRTAVLVDVSYSMFSPLSGRSELNRMDAASGLSILASGLSDSLRVFTFSNAFVEVPPRKGMALRDAIANSQDNSGTQLGRAIREVNAIGYDRLIVITDEQTQDRVGGPIPGSKAYMINVASNRNGVGYGEWTHIDGFSEAVFKFIDEYEKTANR